MRAIETEIKFRIGDENEIEDMLKAIGAEKISEGLEHNESFDNGALRRNGMLLRLRKFNGKNILTFKAGISKDKFKKAEETETEINDFQKMKNILRSLGFKVSWIYEKKRTNFVLGGTKISIDRLPFGTFLEIEGDEEEIREAAEKLGLEIGKGITKTYRRIYEDYCREKGREPEKLVLWEAKG